MLHVADIHPERIEEHCEQMPCKLRSENVVAQMNCAKRPEEQESLASDLSGLCVLIVDDFWDAALGVKMVLESWGVHVLGPVATIAEAERMISDRDPDVAIVDITLRGGEQSHKLIDRLSDKGT